MFILELPKSLLTTINVSVAEKDFSLKINREVVFYGLIICKYNYTYKINNYIRYIPIKKKRKNVFWFFIF